MVHVSRWGTQVEFAAGRGVLRDRDGVEVARLEGDRVWLRGAPGRELVIDPAAEPHPLLGPCAELRSDGVLCSVMGAVRWAAPASIPPVADPGRLPPLTGTMVLNLLAHCAAAAGIPALRYRGPYPTPALFASLRQAFTPLGDEATFTAAAEALLLAPRMIEAPVDFVPAPFERWWLSPTIDPTGAGGAVGAPTPRARLAPIGVQARAQIERVFIDGATFERSPTALRRLVPLAAEAPTSAPAGEAVAAELWFGDARWATVLELDDAGALRRGPLPLPTIEDPIMGQEIPLALRRALADLITETVPALLAPLVAPILEHSTLRWGDAGYQALKLGEHGHTLHAALWMSLRAHGARRVMLALAEALTPWVCSEAINRSRRELERI
jgi:hypothetical protein